MKRHLSSCPLRSHARRNKLVWRAVSQAAVEPLAVMFVFPPCDFASGVRRFRNQFCAPANPAVDQRSSDNPIEINFIALASFATAEFRFLRSAEFASILTPDEYGENLIRIRFVQVEKRRLPSGTLRVAGTCNYSTDCCMFSYMMSASDGDNFCSARPDRASRPIKNEKTARRINPSLRGMQKAYQKIKCSVCAINGRPR